MNELVVVGYGTQKRVKKTGAVATSAPGFFESKGLEQVITRDLCADLLAGSTNAISNSSYTVPQSDAATGIHNGIESGPLMSFCKGLRLILIPKRLRVL